MFAFFSVSCERRITFRMFSIDPIHKGVSLFLSYANMNKVNSLHYVKEHPKISNLLQFESHSSKTFKVRAISDFKDLRSKAFPASLLCFILSLVPIAHQEVQVQC